MTDKEAMKLALFALDIVKIHYTQSRHINEAITALKERLAQPEQEPVCDKDPQGCWNVRCQLGKKCKNTPPQRTWVGLTADEYAELAEEYGPFPINQIEAKLKEKNT